MLGPLETLAQSVSAMAPSTSPSLTIPLVFALAGNATWFVYLLATGATLLVGFCVSRFARLSASPGSLYTYAADTLPPALGVVAAWGLLLAYIATGASVAGGALYYAGVLSQQFFHWTPPALLTLAVVCGSGGMDCLSRRETLGGADAVDRGRLGQPDSDCAGGDGLPLRLSVRSGSVPLKGVSWRRWDPRWCWRCSALWGSRARPRGRRGPGAAQDHSARSVAMRNIGGRVLYGVLVLRSAWASRRSVKAERVDEPAAPDGNQGRRRAAGCGHRYWRGGEPCLPACWPVLPQPRGCYAHGSERDLAFVAAANSEFMVNWRAFWRAAVLAAWPFAEAYRPPWHPGAAIALSVVLMLDATAALSLCGVAGSDMYDWMGSLSVFGFLTAYALVAVACVCAARAGAALALGHGYQRADGARYDPDRDLDLRSATDEPCTASVDLSGYIAAVWHGMG